MKCFTAVEIHFFAQHYGMTLPRGPRAPARGGARQPARRRRGDLPPRGALAHLARQGDGRRVPRGAPRRARARACARTRRCSTGTSRRSSTASTTCSASARCRTRPSGLQAFIPLAFHPDGNGMKNLPAPTAIDALRTVAVSRLLLDNVPHIKAYWVSMTPEVAQIALRFGADDIDGTIVHETIYRAAGSRSPERARPSTQLVRLIQEAGRVAGRARHALQRRARAPAGRAARGGAQGARPQGGAGTWRWCREPTSAAPRRGRRLPQRAAALRGARPRAGERARARSTARSPSEVARRVAEDEADVALMPVAAAATIGDLRLVRGCAIGARGAGAERRPRRRAADRGARGARGRSVVAHERRPRAARPARAPPGTRAAAGRAAGRARRSQSVGGRTRRARHRRPRARDRGALPSRARPRRRRGGSGRGCPFVFAAWCGRAGRARRPTTSASSCGAKRRGPRPPRRHRRRARRAHRACRPRRSAPTCATPSATTSATTSAAASSASTTRPRAPGLLPRARVRFFDEDRRAPPSARPSLDALLARAAEGERLSAAEGERLGRRGVASSTSASPPTPSAGASTRTASSRTSSTATSTTRTSARRAAASARSTARSGTPRATSSRARSSGKKLQEVVDAGGVQILLQGGLHPELRIEWYEDLFRWMKREYRLGLHALSPEEILHIARLEGLDVRARARAPARGGARQRPGRRAPRSSSTACAARSPRPSARATSGSASCAWPTRWACARARTMMYGTVDTAARPRRPPGQDPRSAGRDRRLHRLLLLGLPARARDAHRAGRPRHASSTCGSRPSRGSCSTTSTTSAPRGSRRGPRSGRSRCASAPTTSAA